MPVAVVVLGALAQIVAWSLVARGRGSVWSTVAPVLVAAGATAVAVAPPPLSGRVDAGVAAGVGLATGVALYAATAAFVAVVGSRWRAFGRDAVAIYHSRAGRAGTPVVVGACVVAVAEELFWRGTAQHEASVRVGSALAAGVTLAAYVAANVSSRNLAIVAGAIVGGAVWGALAWWSAGVLASVLAHATWTASMLARPVAGSAR